MPKRIARWNPARDAWEMETTGLFCEHSDVFSETWPPSGTTRGGVAFELPTSGHRTDASACSSLLQTPSVSDATGGHLTRGGDRSGEMLLPGQVRALLPTPVADNSRGLPQSGTDYASLPNAVMDLLPTPRSQNGEDRNNLIWERPLDQPQNLENALARIPALLPTPRATDGTKGGPDQRGSSGDLMLPSAVQSIGDSTNPQSAAGSD